MDLEKYRSSFEELSNIQKTKNLDYYAHPSRYYVAPFKIYGNLYYVGDQKVCSHLIDTGDGLILFDSGFQHTIHLLVQAIWELGFNPSDIKYVIHSHEHFDHIGAANDFKDLYGSKLVISKAGAEVFRNHPDRVYMEANPYPYASIFTPDIELEDGDLITLGNTTIRCVLTPGHSDGVMSFFFEADSSGEKLSVGYFGGVGFNTLYKKALLESGRPISTQKQFCESLKKVREEKVDITLGNHPRQNETLMKRSEMLKNPQLNPFIDPQEWLTFIDKLTHEFELFMESDA